MAMTPAAALGWSRRQRATVTQVTAAGAASIHCTITTAKCSHDLSKPNLPSQPMKPGPLSPR